MHQKNHMSTIARNSGGGEKKFKFKQLPHFLWEAAKMWNDKNPWRMGAVVAYFAVLSLPGLLVLIVNMVGSIYSYEIITGQITGQISEAIGPDAAESIIAILQNSASDDRTMFATIFGIGVLVFGATGVFYHLQVSMNEIWNVKIDPKAGILKVLKDRAISLAFVMVIIFLLIISFVASSALTMLSDYLSSLWVPAYITVAQALEFIISTSVFGFLFILIFKYMPDLKIKWKSVWLGGVITAILFNLGKQGLSFYFGQAEPASTYGAAGSVVLILLWVSYSCLILFYGAAFTRVVAEELNHTIRAKEQAIIFEEREIVIERGSDTVNEPE